MGEYGIISSRLNSSNKSLKEFSSAIRFLRRSGEAPKEEVEKNYLRIESVLDEIINNISGKLSSSTNLDDNDAVLTLRKRHHRDWDEFEKNLRSTYGRISERSSIDKEDIQVLNDVADALDVTCSKLFKRMRRFP